MKFIEKNGNITVMGWKLVTIRVSSNDDLSEKRIAEPGVYFLVDEKTCYSEPEDMSRALSAIWQAEEQWAEHFAEPLRTGRVPGETLDFAIICPLAEREKEKAWQRSGQEDVKRFILDQIDKSPV